MYSKTAIHLYISHLIDIVFINNNRKVDLRKIVLSKVLDGTEFGSHDLPSQIFLQPYLTYRIWSYLKSSLMFTGPA